MASSERRTSNSFKLFRLEDYSKFSYYEMTSTVELHLGAIVKNEDLQMALRQLLVEDDINTIRDLFAYCTKTGCLLGHRKDITLNKSVADILDKLTCKDVTQNMTEMQSLLLFSEALTSFPPNITTMLISLSPSQRQTLLRQLHATPLGTNLHSFTDKGAWKEPALRPILEEIGYRLINGRLQLRRSSLATRDIIRSASVALLSVDVILSDSTLLQKSA